MQSVHDVILTFAVLLQMEWHLAALRRWQKGIQFRIFELYVMINLGKVQLLHLGSILQIFLEQILHFLRSKDIFMSYKCIKCQLFLEHFRSDLSKLCL